MAPEATVGERAPLEAGSPASGASGPPLTLGRLVRREPPPQAVPGPVVPDIQRQPAQTEARLPTPSVAGEATAEAAEPVGRLSEPDTTAPRAAPPASPAGGLVPTLRRLVRRGPPSVAESAEVTTTSAAARPGEAEPPTRTPATAPASAEVTGLFADGPPLHSRVSELQVEPWTPVYRSSAARRFPPDDGSDRKAAWTAAPPQQGEPVPAMTMLPVDQMRDSQTLAPASEADREAEEGYALARQAGGVVAIQRQAAVGEASVAAADGAPAEETASRAGAVEKLAQQVYELVRRRLQVERERAGLGSTWL